MASYTSGGCPSGDGGNKTKSVSLSAGLDRWCSCQQNSSSNSYYMMVRDKIIETAIDQLTGASKRLRDHNSDTSPSIMTTTTTTLSGEATKKRSRQVRSESGTMVLLTLLAVLFNSGAYIKLIASDSNIALLQPERPKLIPLAIGDSYSEGASVTLLCTVAQGQHESLTFEWFKDSINLSHQHHQTLQQKQSNNNNNNKLNVMSSGMQQSLTANNRQLASQQQQSSSNGNIIIEKHQDHSLLRIPKVALYDSGQYKCLARNQFGQDSSSVNLIVDVKLSWLKEPKDTVVSLNQDISVDCLAQSEPRPKIRWERLSNNAATAAHLNLNGPLKNQANSFVNQVVSSSRFLNISRASRADSGLYECVASNNHDKDLRKVIQVHVRVPAKFDEKFTVIQVRSGDSVRLECNATGDLPMIVEWFKEGDNKTLDKHGTDGYDIYEATTEHGINSFMIIRSIQREDGILYKCQAQNDHGKSEKLTKLVIVGVPSKPFNLQAKDVWSRSASLVWSAPFGGNSRIINYTIQYWRKGLTNLQEDDFVVHSTTSATNTSGFVTSSKPNLHSNTLTQHQQQQQQNHRREELVIDGLQTAALIPNLYPSVTYECSVIAYNQVGKSDASDSVIFTTTEEEPSAPPTDVAVETLGPTTLRVSWKAPPIETWNGRLLGFYVGHRLRYTHTGASNSQSQLSSMIDLNKIDSRDVDLMMSPTNIALQQHTMAQVIYSFKTVDFVKNIIHYDTFLNNLRRGQEYQVTVKAFNRAGSGPESHVIHAVTSEGKQLPGAPTLYANKVTSSGVTLRWTNTNNNHYVNNNNNNNNFVAPIRRHIIYFQLVGEPIWSEVIVNRNNNDDTTNAAMDSSSETNINNNNNNELAGNLKNEFLQTNLLAGSTYRSYIVAVNDYGFGDPSNIVIFKTESSNGNNNNNLLLKEGLNVSHQQDNIGSQMSGSDINRQQFIYAFFGASGLIVIIVVIMGTVACARRIHRAFHTSSSYPSSWTPASNTMQSGYSVKRFIDFEDSVIVNSNNNNNSNNAAANQPTNHQIANSNHVLNHGSLFTETATLNHPSRYQHIDQVNQKILQQQQQIRQSTIARAQQRSLPPIPYSTLTVNDIVMNKPTTNKTFGKMDSLQHQQQIQQQQQQQQLINHYHTSLIYDVTD